MRLALFDLDGTLTRGDTLLPFLRFVAGTPALAAGLVRLAPMLVSAAAGWSQTQAAKEAVLTHFLRGKRAADLQRAGEQFARRSLPALARAHRLEQLRSHRASGDTCVLVTASLDLYVEPWARMQGFDAVLSSRLETRDGIATGRLDGLNCYGGEKVRRIRAWLGERAVRRSWAYGDSRGDREMLEFADESFYRGRRIK